MEYVVTVTVPVTVSLKLNVSDDMPELSIGLLKVIFISLSTATFFSLSEGTVELTFGGSFSGAFSVLNVNV